MTMTPYAFTLILNEPTELDEALADQLFTAGCDDGTPGMCAGLTVIDFHRKGQSLEAAIRSAVADVNAAGCVVTRVEIYAEHLVSA